MRIYAILSDIHGNFQALQAVEQDARQVSRQEKVNQLEFICLGDVVDYGPQPDKCMDWVIKHAVINIQGNHDRVAAAPFYELPYPIDPNFWPITLWTRRTLQPIHKDHLLEWPTRRSQVQGLSNHTFFHSSLTHQDGYIDNIWPAKKNLEKIQTPFGFFGHTHIQGYFEEVYNWRRDKVDAKMHLVWSADLPPAKNNGWHPVQPGEWTPMPDRAIFNAGSVGQPRSHPLTKSAGAPGDSRAAYMLLRMNGSGDGHFQFRRVDYDQSETIRLLREEVRWSAASHPEEVASHSIYKEKNPHLHPLRQKLQETLATIEDDLPRLIEKKLIPALQQID